MKHLQKQCWVQGQKNHLYRKSLYKEVFFDKPVKKSRGEVVTAQGAKCKNIVIAKLKIRRREFTKPWQSHILEDLEYPCILGSESEYQASSFEEDRHKADQVQSFKNSESGERRVEQGKNTSLTGDQGGRRNPLRKKIQQYEALLEQRETDPYNLLQETRLTRKAGSRSRGE
ncbi:hypothetical protein TNCV_1331151, partial [Trichonephila clavipes]